MNTMNEPLQNEAIAFGLAVESAISSLGITPTEFGKMAAGDPNFVFDLRKGREPRFATRKKVLEFMAKQEPAE